jgi:multidrug resistance efflux pump
MFHIERRVIARRILTLNLLLTALLCSRIIYADTASRWVQGIGYIEPKSEVRRLVFKHSGIVERIEKEVGQSVKQGEIIAVQRSDEERTAVAVAQSNLMIAKAELAKVVAGINPLEIKAKQGALNAAKADRNYAEIDLRRVETLSKKQLVSISAYDLAKTDLQRKTAVQSQLFNEVNYLKNYVRTEDRELAEAKVTLADSELGSALQRLEETIIRAPHDGTVLEILHHPGESTFGAVGPEPIVLLGDLKQLRIRAEIDENYALALKAGQTAVIFGRGLGKLEISGRVKLVKPVMGKKTVFTKISTERKDIDVIQVFIEPNVALEAPVGLEVDVKVDVGSKNNTP